MRWAATATFGLREYRRWFRLLAENGGKFTRIWLSGAYLQAETEVAGEVTPLIFNRLDGIVELARRVRHSPETVFRPFPRLRSETR